ncbi:Glutamate--tRNA ligase [Candidatus Fokinia solitaria]|uniref:Glutamate--tRNA ligase n=1 Tax=Candidatus Fokinia solitaria TaxID=1802984 RepID=A0A2U8BT01_9RICK|nr:glutamate--tRNA ligase [Candidatus Fokinia solitaria]AWD33472.1 Glutamate--tRNA ligase [Candidatus Fokinia solitaria]
MAVVVRFAPSPTGYIHVGNARAALITWLFARSHKGYMLLRIDDLDVTRSEERYTEQIITDLSWLGIDWDYKFTQTSRRSRYQEVVQMLYASGFLYKCYETKSELQAKKERNLIEKKPPIYDRESLYLTDEQRSEFEAAGRKCYFRFKIPDDIEITWMDEIKGEISVPSNSLSDPIVMTADQHPLYNFASVVDDYDYGVTHIIRGEDHLTNTAFQILLFKALGAIERKEESRITDDVMLKHRKFCLLKQQEGSLSKFKEVDCRYRPQEDFQSFNDGRKNKDIPVFAHLSLFYGHDAEISKRLGGFDIKGLREDGIHPMAINSFLAKINTSMTIDTSMSLNELINDFGIECYNKSNVCYDKSNLISLNAALFRNMSNDVFIQAFREYHDMCMKNGIERSVQNHALVEKVESDNDMLWRIVREEVNTFPDVYEWLVALYGSAESQLSSIDKEFADKALALMQKYESFDEEKAKVFTHELKDAVGLDKMKFFKAFRHALIGREVGPEVWKILVALGKQRVQYKLESI